MRFPTACDICTRQKVGSELFHGSIEIGPRPFKGPSPLVMLVGQDPTVAKGQVDSVLDLENLSGSLYKYIVVEILKPAGLKLDEVYATDLVKCRFPDNQTPKAISQNHSVTIKDFLSPFFGNCRQWFFEEVRETRPRVILSLGQPVHQLLIEEFGWDAPGRMKEAFGNVYEVTLLGDNILYAPSIHINSKRQLHYKNLWKRFIQNLGEAVDSARIV